MLLAQVLTSIVYPSNQRKAMIVPVSIYKHCSGYKSKWFSPVNTENLEECNNKEQL